MVAKAVLILCAQALFIQTIAAQCSGAAYPAWTGNPINTAPLGLATPLGTPCASATWGAFPASSLAASHGPGLAITSASPISPVGVSVASDNAIEGPLAVAGAIPFLGTVELEGALPTAGAGAVEYECGIGEVAILEEDIAAPIEVAAAPLGLATAPLGLASAPLGLAAAPLGYPTSAAGPLGFTGSMGYGPIAAPFGGCGARF